MAEWKKVIVSGSIAELATLTVDNNINATSVTASLLGDVVGNLTGNADTATTASYALNAPSASYAVSSSHADLADEAVALQTARDFSVTGSGITAAAVSFDGTGAVVLNASIDANAVTTAKILDANVTNAKLANASLTVGSTNIALGASSTVLAGLTSVTSTGFTGALTGNADTATALQTARDFSVTGSGITAAAVSFDGTGAVVLNASIDDNAVTTAKIADDAVTTAKIAAGAVGTTELAADAVTNAKLADNAVETANIVAANVTNDKLANSSLTVGSTSIALGATVTTIDSLTLTNAIATGSFTGSFAGVFTGTTDLPDLVSGNGLTGGPYDGAATATFAVLADGSTLSVSGTGVKVADSGITATQIATGAVGTTELAADAVTNAKLADNAVETANIVDLNVTTGKLADNAVTTVKITDANVTNAKLANSSLTVGSTNIALGASATTLAGLTSVTSTNLTGSLLGNVVGAVTGNASTATALQTARDFSVTGSGITAAAVSFNGTGDVVLNASIDADAVTTAKIADGAVTTAKIADANVTTAKIADLNVTTGKLAADAVTNAKLADSAVQTANIVDANVTNAKLANSSLTVGSTNIALGASSTVLAGLTSVTSTGFTGALTGNADTATTASYVAASSAAQGQVTVTGTVVDLGLETTDSVTFANLAVNGSGSYSGALVVQGDLTVNGTASFINTQELLVEDKFVTFASGSTTATDGGFIVSQAAGNIGQAFAFQSGTGRWGVESGVAYNATSITPDAYVSLVATSNSDTAYQKAGNIFVDGSGDIFMWA